MIRMLTTCLFLFLMMPPVLASSPDAVIANHEAADDFDTIPASYFDVVRESCRLFYGHTSHGSQVVSGLQLLEDEDPYLCALPPLVETGDDLGHNGYTGWVQPTRDYLDANPDCTMVMWSWCGGCSDNTPTGIAAYLNAMSMLEGEYPDVVFVYMTGHLDGSGPLGNLRQNNDRIRDYCRTHGKVLYDFADIESWSPDGHYHPYEDDSCSWCGDWCVDMDCPSASCAHSHAYNCYRKGKAFWWLLAAVHGWKTSPGQAPGEASQLSRLGPARPNPFNPSTTLTFSLSRSGQARLVVLDAAGRHVATLADGHFEAGEHSAVWNGRDTDGRPMPSGIYLARVDAAGASEVRRMSLVK